MYICKLESGKDIISPKLTVLHKKIEDEIGEGKISYEILSFMYQGLTKMRSGIKEIHKVRKVDYFRDELELRFPDYKDNKAKEKYYINKLLKLNEIY